MEKVLKLLDKIDILQDKFCEMLILREIWVLNLLEKLF